jgi:hypothetical protein
MEGWHGGDSCQPCSSDHQQSRSNDMALVWSDLCCLLPESYASQHQL